MTNNDPYSPNKLAQISNLGQLPHLKTTKAPKTTTPAPNQNYTKSRPKRIVPLIIAGIGAAVGAANAGTAFEIVTKHSLENLAQKVSDLQSANTLSLLLHVPIAPPEAFMRLYKLHPFPLPFDNGTLLTHNVKNEILAISNSNLRYTLQMSTVDLLGCHQLGKTFLCPSNGLLNKYPQDSCLGSLYHQKFDIAHQLCDFKVKPPKEFIYQLLNNWFMVYEPVPLTVLVTCSNGSHSELHVR